MNILLRWNLDPVCLRIGDFYELRFYTICFMLGLFGAFVIVQFRKRHFLPKRTDVSLELLAVYIFWGILIGARLGHCLFYDWAYFSQHPIEIISPISFEDGQLTITGFLGLASHGGIIGIGIALIIYSKRWKVHLMDLLDLIASVALIAGAMIRIGNFMNSEILGMPTHANYGVIFAQVDLIPRHPAQLYEAMAYLLIFWLTSKKIDIWKKARGEMAGWVFILVFITRFLIEFIKEDQSRFEQGMMLNMGQWLSLPLIGLGMGLIIYSKRNPGRA